MFKGVQKKENKLQYPVEELIKPKRTKIMGIINATPDSFYADSRMRGLEHGDLPLAVSDAMAMVDAGADILDIGGESTRPGSSYISEEEELGRVIPIISGIADALKERGNSSVKLSVDTRKSLVASEALECGVTIINDISALRDDPLMGKVIGEAGSEVVLMHRKGIPLTMQENPLYEDVVEEILSFFLERIDSALKAGIGKDKIILDPGLGFGKRYEDNMAILANLERFKELGFPLLIAHSRKQFVGEILVRRGLVTQEESKPSSPEERLLGTLAVSIFAAQSGVDIIRVHDVAETRQMIDVLRECHGKNP